MLAFIASCNVDDFFFALLASSADWLVVGWLFVVPNQNRPVSQSTSTNNKQQSNRQTDNQCLCNFAAVGGWRRVKPVPLWWWLLLLLSCFLVIPLRSPGRNCRLISKIVLPSPSTCKLPQRRVNPLATTELVPSMRTTTPPTHNNQPTNHQQP